MTSRPRSNENTVQHAIRLAAARIVLHGRCRGPVAQQGGQICISRALGFADNCGDGACQVESCHPQGDASAASRAAQLIAAETFTRWDADNGYEGDDDHFEGAFDACHLEALGDLTWLTDDDGEVFDVLNAAYARAGLLPTKDGDDV